jgi:hypothetical protein
MRNYFLIYSPSQRACLQNCYVHLPLPVVIFVINRNFKPVPAIDMLREGVRPHEQNDFFEPELRLAGRPAAIPGIRR